MGGSYSYYETSQRNFVIYAIATPHVPAVIDRNSFKINTLRASMSLARLVR